MNHGIWAKWPQPYSGYQPGTPKWECCKETVHHYDVCRPRSNLSGLWINPLYPHFGACPDVITTCSCCGDGLLEIKCGSFNNEICAFLKDSGYLSWKHHYYTQVQGHLMISGQLFCDFSLNPYHSRSWTNIPWCALLREIGKMADIIFQRAYINCYYYYYDNFIGGKHHL